MASYLSIAAAGAFPGQAQAASRPLTSAELKLLQATAGELPSAEVVAHVHQAVRGDPDQSWRLAALELMARHATASDVGILIQLVPEEAGEAAGTALLEAFRAAWIELAHRDPAIYSELDRTGFVPAAVALEMVRAAGAVAHPRGATWIAEQLDDPDLVDAALQEIGRVAQALPPARSQSIAAAVRPFLASDEASRRGHALRALAAMGDTGAVPGMIEMLDRAEGGELLRLHAALRELSGCNLPDRPEAWRAWHQEQQRWWDEEAPGVLERLASEDAGLVVAAIRDASARTLRRDQLAASVAVALRDHASPEVRRQACAGLARLGSDVALEDLVRALDDPDAGVREGAVQALRSITRLALPPDRGAWLRALEDGHRPGRP